jgi:hypothetical protein
MSAPRSTHYAVVLRILRYIKGTLFHGLHFSVQSSLELCAYVDVDWAGDLKGFPFSLSLKHSDSFLNHTIKEQFE